MINNLKRMVASLSLSMALWGIALLPIDLVPRPVEAIELNELIELQPPKDALQQWLEKTQDKEKYEILKELARCESNFLVTAVNWDDGGSPSYGLLQIKQKTFEFYNSRYGFYPNIEYDEIINVIYDPDSQIELAARVLDEPLGWRNWLNCLKTKKYEI